MDLWKNSLLFFLENSSIESINKAKVFVLTKFFANDSLSLLVVLLFISVTKVEPVERNIDSMQERYENSIYVQNVENNAFLLILVHSCAFILIRNS